MYKVTDRPKELCCGCGACAQICPRECISMNTDGEGFSYPNVDTLACVNCGKCESVCPINNEGANGTERPIAYGAQTKNEEICRASSSGGIFSALAMGVLRQGGVVFGAALDEDFSVRHICVSQEAELEKLRGSKYVQSIIGNAYRDAKAFLNVGRLVLFSGTPCQIAGLRCYLGKDYENLFAVDIICHGVPSPLVWNEYVKYLEEKAGSKLVGVSFRDKEKGWIGYRLRYRFSDGTTVSKPSSEDYYMRSFLRNLCIRPSCYRCAFKSEKHDADITLGDFWGVEKVCPEVADDRGISLVLVQTARGQAFFRSIAKQLSYREVDLDEAIRYNASLITSAKENPNREAFLEKVYADGFEKCIKDFLMDPLCIRLRKIVKKILLCYRRK